MTHIKIWNDSPSRGQLDQIAEIISDGGIAILPTDTMYALVCDAFNHKAIERLCRLKGIDPSRRPLSILCRDISMAAEYTKIPDSAFRLMRANTPGPFTFILRAASTLPKAFKGRKEVGVRIPDSNLISGLLEIVGHPLMATSILYESDDYALNPDLIAEYHESTADIMVEGDEGTLEESTIVDLKENDPTIIRQGKGILE